MRTVIRRMVMLATMLALLASVALPARGSLADVTGNTYTSPTNGYTITWPADWFFIEESTEPGYDYLWIGDGVSTAQFFGGPAPGTPQQELGGVIVSFGGTEGIVNFAPQLDDQGAPVRASDDAHAYVVYTYAYDLGDGTLIDSLVRLEVFSISPGVSVVAVFDTTMDIYQANPAVFDGVMSGMSFNSGTLPDPDVPAPAPDPVNPAPPLVPNSEPTGQTVVNSQWRFAIASTTVGAEIPSLQLELKDGREWVAVFADVTNWTTTDGTFSLRDPLVQTAQMTEAWDIAPSSTRQVARLLGITPQGNNDVAIAAEVTTRIVLVYSIPAGGTEAELLIGQSSLSLSDHFNLAFDPAALPAQAAAPSTLEGTVTNVSVNSAGAVTFGLVGSTEEYVLIGADLPSGSDCYGAEALNEVIQYIDASVLIESDPAVEGAASVYLWIVQPDGTRTLLNQELIDTGAARVANLPDAARFAGWLRSSESAAQQAGAGLWGTC